MKVTNVMTRDVIAVPAELDLRAAWRLMERENIRHLPVLKSGELIGILSDRDLLGSGVYDKGKLRFSEQATVNDAMSPLPCRCTTSASVSSVAALMLDKKIDAVPVVNDGRVVGLVTSSDLLELLREYDAAQPMPFRYRMRLMPEDGKVIDLENHPGAVA